MEYWSDGVMEYWSDGVLEYWSHGLLEKTFPVIFGWIKCFAHTYLNMFLPIYIHRENDHIALLSKTAFSYTSVSITLNTPILQYSNTPALCYRQSQLSVT